MNALRQLELPGITARIEKGLIVEQHGETQLCGRELAIAKAWEKWVVATSLRPGHQERPALPGRPEKNL